MTECKDNVADAGRRLTVRNLFEAANPPASGETFTVLLARRNLVVERIVSSDRTTPTEYVQAQDEWVVLLQGEAELLVAGVRHALKAGDYLFLPARTPHTVLRTSSGALWLGVHLHPDTAGGPAHGGVDA